jgi:hypothetical protein
MLTITIGDLILESVYFHNLLQSNIHILKEIPNLPHTGFLFGIDFIAPCLLVTETADRRLLWIHSVALFADDAVAVEDVATGGAEADLAEVARDAVLGFLH